MIDKLMDSIFQLYVICLLTAIVVMQMIYQTNTITAVSGQCTGEFVIEIPDEPEIEELN